jgi:cell division protein FtsL
MCKNNLDRVCQRRIKSSDFGKPQTNCMPTSKFEKKLIAFLILILLVLISVQVYKTFA